MMVTIIIISDPYATKSHNEQFKKEETNPFVRLSLPKENHVPWNRNLTHFLQRRMVQDYKQHIQSSNKEKRTVNTLKKKNIYICLILVNLVCN